MTTKHEKTRKVIADMQDTAIIRRNMGEYSLASTLQRWGDKLLAAVSEDERKEDGEAGEKDRHC